MGALREDESVVGPPWMAFPSPQNRAQSSGDWLRGHPRFEAGGAGSPTFKKKAKRVLTRSRSAVRPHGLYHSGLRGREPYNGIVRPRSSLQRDEWSVAKAAKVYPATLPGRPLPGNQTSW